MGGPSKLNSANIPTATPEVTDLFFFANPSTGLGKKNALSALVALLATSTAAPVKTYADTTAQLANVDIPIQFFAFVSDATDDPDAGAGWALYLYLGGDRDDLGSYVLIMYEAFSGGGGGTSFTWITAAPSLPQATDKHYVVEPGTTPFTFLGFTIEPGMEIFVKAGATTMAGVVFKP